MTLHRTVWTAILFVSVPATLAAQDKPMPEEKPGLLAKARVTPDSARRIARSAVPNSTISSEEIEMEGGKLIYTFDLRVAGKRGIEEVHVDALTGRVIAREHEEDAQAKPAAKKKPGA